MRRAGRSICSGCLSQPDRHGYFIGEPSEALQDVEAMASLADYWALPVRPLRYEHFVQRFPESLRQYDHFLDRDILQRKLNLRDIGLSSSCGFPKLALAQIGFDTEPPQIAGEDLPLGFAVYSGGRHAPPPLTLGRGGIEPVFHDLPHSLRAGDLTALATARCAPPPL